MADFGVAIPYEKNRGYGSAIQRHIRPTKPVCKYAGFIIYPDESNSVQDSASSVYES